MKDEEYRELEVRIRDYMREHLNQHYSNLKNPVRSTIIDRTNALSYRSAAVQWRGTKLLPTNGVQRRYWAKAFVAVVQENRGR